MKELLVPVGNMDTLKAAINAGADAVYLGGKKFGARGYADNFTEEELVEAINLCHTYDVLIYITVNTLIYESEFNDAINYIEFLYKNGVDAVIIQDIGLMKVCHEKFPDLDIHASTQTHITNEETVKFLEELGVKRVVFARELSVNAIDDIETPLEKEAFIHGALCVSFSGECLFSSIIMGRSGNRGVCTGACRLPYKLKENDNIIDTEGNYLLSTKELNSIDNFKNILKSSIYSLKIEGRMKSKEYVACVTKLYRTLIDKYYNNEEIIVDDELVNDLKVIYNREYTKGFINQENSNDLMNIKTSNHVGIPLGKVVDISKKYISIKLDKILNQGDAIRFNEANEGMFVNFLYDKHENLINHGDIGQVVLVDNKFHLTKVATINKTVDIKVLNKYDLIPDKKVSIDLTFNASLNKPLELIYNDIRVTYGQTEEAKSRPTTKEDVEKQISKLGSTPFKLNKLDINMDDNLFISLKELNELRRLLVEKIIENKISVDKRKVLNYESTYKKHEKISGISFLVRNEEQLLYLLDKVDRIYVADKFLYNKYKVNSKVYYRDSIAFKVTKDNNVLSMNLGSLYINNNIGDASLNIVNHESLNYLSNYASLLTLSHEVDGEELDNLMKNYKECNVEYIIYSHIELMNMLYCPLKLLVNKDKVCHVCSNNSKYYLIDRNEKEFRILTDKVNHITTIMDHKYTDKINNIDYYKKLGINNFRIELLDEGITQIDNILNRIQ